MCFKRSAQRRTKISPPIPQPLVPSGSICGLQNLHIWSNILGLASNPGYSKVQSPKV